MTQVNVNKQDKLGAGETCSGTKDHFTTAKGVEVFTFVYEDRWGERHGYYCFTRETVHVGLQLENDDVLRDEQAVGEFIDSLRQISPEEISAYYKKK